MTCPEKISTHPERERVKWESEDCDDDYDEDMEFRVVIPCSCLRTLFYAYHNIYYVWVVEFGPEYPNQGMNCKS